MKDLTLGSHAWTYNAHHQLTQWGDPTATASSPLTSIVTPKTTQTFDGNGHLATKTVTPQDLTPAGIESGKQSHRYFYNASERLIRVTDGSSANAGEGADIASYAYDPFGRRIKKVVSQNPSGSTSVQIGTTTYFYADEGLIAETDGTGNISSSYGWMPNGTWGTAPVWKRDYQAQTSTEHYYHTDHLGTPQRLTNAAGEITWRAYSEAFGKTTVDASVTPVSTPATQNNLRFPGQLEDSETGAHYNYFRDYDPQLGRYAQSDLIGLRGGINTYAYVSGNPLSYSDRDGLKITGSWLESPKIVDPALSITGYEFISPYWSWWGYINVVRVYGAISGNVRFGVRCFDDAKGCLNADAWDLRAQIPVSKSGHHDFGPNVYGLLAGARFGLRGSLLMNAAIIAATSSLAVARLKSEYGAAASAIYSALLIYGPTGICNSGLPDFAKQ